MKTVRARRALALVLIVASLAGCAGRGAKLRTDPTARDRKGSRLTETQQKVYEARDQSSVDVTEPYWPYRLGEVYAEADSNARA